jgi:hypothetical protein
MHTNSISFQLALCLSLLAPVAMARDSSAPDRTRRQDMSYEEYTALREKMRMRMEKMHPQPSEQTEEKRKRPAEQAERETAGGAYGKGFDSRKLSNDRPDTAADRRPERPRFERFNRAERGRP